MVPLVMNSLPLIVRLPAGPISSVWLALLIAIVAADVATPSIIRSEAAAVPIDRTTPVAIDPNTSSVPPEVAVPAKSVPVPVIPPPAVSVPAPLMTLVAAVPLKVIAPLVASELPAVSVSVVKQLDAGLPFIVMEAASAAVSTVSVNAVAWVALPIVKGSMARGTPDGDQFVAMLQKPLPGLTVVAEPIQVLGVAGGTGAITPA